MVFAREKWSIMEDNKKEHKTIGMNIPMQENLMNRINKAALNNNLTKAAYVRQAIEEKLKKDGFGVNYE